MPATSTEIPQDAVKLADAIAHAAADDKHYCDDLIKRLQSCRSYASNYQLEQLRQLILVAWLSSSEARPS